MPSPKSVCWCSVHGHKACEMRAAAREGYGAYLKRKPSAESLIMVSMDRRSPEHGAVYTRMRSKEEALRVLGKSIRAAKAAATRKANREKAVKEK